ESSDDLAPESQRQDIAKMRSFKVVGVLSSMDCLSELLRFVGWKNNTHHSSTIFSAAHRNAAALFFQEGLRGPETQPRSNLLFGRKERREHLRLNAWRHASPGVSNRDACARTEWACTNYDSTSVYGCVDGICDQV